MATVKVYAATVLVSDQDRAIDFYVNRLGFEKRDDSAYGDGGRWVVVAPPGAEAGFSLLSPSQAQRPDATIGGYTGISLVTSDIQAAYAELSGRGVQFQSPPQRMPWGELATWFSDPDGNSFFLAETR